MVFSSISFLSGFLLLVFLIHTIVPNIHIKNACLVLFSILFYAVGEPVYVLLMLGSSFVNYLFGLWMEQAGKKQQDKLKKGILIAAVILNLAVLVVFKYTDFLIGIINQIGHVSIPYLKLVMPIGISFFTFQTMSYIIDLCRGDCDCQKNYFRLLLYISFFPQLIAGPIIKYRDIEAEITDRRQTVTDVECGIRRFIVGLSKKVLISNALAQMVDRLMPHASGLGMAAAWFVAIGYTLQIYYDFSGYSDMAIGLGRMFGFHFKENFNYPYASLSIKEFWRRWHISLSTWFKEYVYIPLGGNRKGSARTILNKYIVFFLTGLWHGANTTFILWGLFHGTFLVLEGHTKLSIKRVRWKWVQYLYTMLVVICGFVMFRADSVTQGFRILGQMFSFRGNAAGWVLAQAELTPYLIVALILGIVFMVPWVEAIKRKLQTCKRAQTASVVQIVSGVGLLACMLLCMVMLASDAYNPFIYFRF
ncbi:MBOAT family O-acyltransferase [Wujia sp.]|uniref:MBOAT family O-acyltransferase n=1 Tax=Wujia sp. TaxID=2944172 RepID=UPI003F7ED84A